MDEVLTVYANPPAGTKPQCEKNSDGIYTDPGGRLCGVGNSATNITAANKLHVNSVANDAEAFSHAQNTQKLINDAQIANAKLLASESARLDAQQQAVKNLVEKNKINLASLQAQSLQTRQSMSALQNKVQADFAIQQQRIQQSISSSNQRKQEFQSQMQSTLNRIKSLPNPKAAEHAQKLQREAESKAKEEMDRITEEHNQQIAEFERQKQEIKIQLKAQEHQMQEEIANFRKANEINQLDEQGRNHEYSQQILGRQNKIDRASNPEHLAHLWLNDAKSLIHHAEHSLQHWQHMVHVNNEKKHAAFIKYDIPELTEAIHYLADSEIRLHDSLLHRDRARFIMTAAENKMAQIQEQLKTNREAIRISQELITTRNEKKEEVTSLTKGLSFLSTTQQDLKTKEIAACETLTCDIGSQAKWNSIEASQALTFAGGMIAGVPAEFHDAVKGIYDLATSPAETYTALKALVNSDNVLGNVTNAVKEKWIAHIDNMVAAQERGGVAGYFEAGVEGGKIVTDVAATGLLSVGATKTSISVVKSGVTAGEKILAKSINKNPNLVNRYNLNPPIKTYGPLQVGPLGNPNDLTTPASTFRSGTYVEKIATEELYFYRDHGGSAKANGRFWTTEPSNGPLQSQLDSAILPEWGNTFENHSVINIPIGTKYYEGYSASQAGSQGLQPTLHGGGTQIFLPSLKNEWILNK